MTSLLVATLVLIVGAVLTLAFTGYQRRASAIGALCAVSSCAWGTWLSVRALQSGDVEVASWRWLMPNAALSFGMDALTAFFLVPLFVLGGLAAAYGYTYLRQHAPDRNLSIPWAAYNLLIASMAILLLARHAILFLVAWEVMSLAGYLLVSFDHQQLSVRRASFIYLIATHLGVSCLIGMFLLFGNQAHSFEFRAFSEAATMSPTVKSCIFGLGLLGFGTKAGLFPLHVWLPEAHAAAPSHVSALMSGVLIKMGIYGLLRLMLLLGDPRPFWGISLMILGIAGGTVGMTCAVYQRDIKRLLAYSSIENVGLISLGLGAALWGAATHRPLVATLGLMAGLLHIWNHAVMKALMFLGAGSIVHQCHSRDIEQLGGLYRRMPYTASGLVLGAVALAGLPPLNGFVSEWLLYGGLLRTSLDADGGTAVALLTAVAIMSLIGTLAALCFTRFAGIALLGHARSVSAMHASEAPIGMRVPTVILAAIVLALSVQPLRFATLLRPVVIQLLGSQTKWRDIELVLARIGSLNLVLLLVLAAGIGTAVLLQTARRVRQGETWGCGYAAPTSRMQYGGRAFSQLFTSNILPGALGPRQAFQPPRELFPYAACAETSIQDPLTRAIYEPFLERWAHRFMRLRVMQQGVLHAYILYILVTLLLALAFSAYVSMGGPG